MAISFLATGAVDVNLCDLDGDDEVRGAAEAGSVAAGLGPRPRLGRSAGDGSGKLGTHGD